MGNEVLKVKDLIAILENMPQDAIVEIESPRAGAEWRDGGPEMSLRYGVTQATETWYNSPKQKVVVLGCE